MEAASQNNAANATSPSIVLLVAAGSYVFRFVSATDEFGSQLGNLQRTLANQLRLLPTELVSRHSRLTRR